MATRKRSTKRFSNEDARLQSAMEYLMTYSWSILIIAIILGALFALGTFSSNSYQGTSCIAITGYLCQSPVLNTTGNLLATFSNEGYPIIITATGCTTNASLPASTVSESPSVSLQAGAQTGLLFHCHLSGNSIGTAFTGHLWIVYDQGSQSGLYADAASVSAKVSTSSAVASASQFVQTFYYAPVTITNSQALPAPQGFQQMITFNPSSYYTYANGNLGNIRFYSGAPNTGSPLYSWCESGCTNTSSSAVFWVVLPGGVPANGATTINVVFEGMSTQYDGIYAGEAPQLSPTYGAYDNGASVFINYYRGDSTGGWTVAGSSGATASAPSGSPFGIHALYAKSANGDYLYTLSNMATSGNYIIQFYAYTTGLGNLFFMANSAGKGVMSRLDGRGGADYSGLAKTSAWTSWYCPESGVDLLADKWYMLEVDLVGGTEAGDWYSTGLSYEGALTQLNALSATYADGCGGGTETYSSDVSGSYMGLVGDGLGSSYLTYWNGIMVRYYPPGGLMPVPSIGNVQTG